jgi:hypothetical protein
MRGTRAFFFLHRTGYLTATSRGEWSGSVCGGSPRGLGWESRHINIFQRVESPPRAEAFWQSLIFQVSICNENPTSLFRQNIY